MRRVLLVLILLLLAAPAGAGGTGDLVLIGGGEKPAEAMERFIELAGGREADIVVFPTASSEPDTAAYYLQLFGENYGCRSVRIAQVHGRKDASDPHIADLVSRADGIFFGGGDQRRITAALLDTPVGGAVRAAWRRGVVVGGTSAGTACMSGRMITGDGDFTVLRAGAVENTPGWGFFRGVIVDQHFVARARLSRLLALVLEHPELVGVGVDEATAVHVRPDGTFDVLGDGWVVVLDARKAKVTEGHGEKALDLGVRDARLHVLLPGDTFDLKLGVAEPPSG